MVWGLGFIEKGLRRGLRALKCSLGDCVEGRFS